jgi:cytidylate kinase
MEVVMAIITISRGSASGGALLAEGLANRLGYEQVSREDVVDEAARFGVSSEALGKALLEPVGFWERFKHERWRYLSFVQEILCERAKNDRIVYLGHAGQFLLRGVSHVLCVMVIAPMPFRIRIVMERDKVSHNEAVHYIERMDRQRKEWARFLYGVDWLDPSLYDLTINLKTLNVEGAVDVVAAAVEREEFQPTEASRKAMTNLLLSSRVRAALAADKTTASAEVDVRAESGVVYLKGKVRSSSMVDSVVRVAGRVEGVREVSDKDLGAPDYTV